MSAKGPDQGGAFLQVSHDYSESGNGPELHLNGSFGSRYDGYAKAVATGVSENSGFWPLLPLTFWDMSSLNALGAVAIARVSPTNPVADLSTFIGELREGLPRLGIETFRSRSQIARNAGSDYLNLEFGWKPLVSDLQKFAYAVRNKDKILAQYERNSGKPVRRSMELLNEVSTEVEVTANKLPPPFPIYFHIDKNIKKGTLRRVRTTNHRIWFSGSFTYYLSLSKDSRKRFLQEANKLFGVRLTPETVWNLTPWSWAADWVGNLGDVIHNISAFHSDGLVMPYAYLMEEYSISETFELSGVVFNYDSNRPIPGNYSQTFTTTGKKRVSATPFGFGLLPDVNFTSRQKAIIAALGLTKNSR